MTSEQPFFSAFEIHWGLFIAPIVVIFLIAKKVPAAAALMIGTLLGALTAVIFQPEVVRSVAGMTNEVGYGMAAFKATIQSMALDSSVTTSNGMANDLLESSGMAGHAQYGLVDSLRHGVRGSYASNWYARENHSGYPERCSIYVWTGFSNRWHMFGF